MFTFSLTRTEPKGQNSHTCMLRGRDVGFPGGKTAFCPLQAGSKTSVLWQPQLGSAGPPKIAGWAALDVPLHRSSPARGVTMGSKGSMGWIELSSIWHFDKEQHILKLKPCKNMQKYLSHTSNWSQCMLWGHMRLSFTKCVVEILGYVNMDVTQCEENCIKTDYSQKKREPELQPLYCYTSEMSLYPPCLFRWLSCNVSPHLPTAVYASIAATNMEVTSLGPIGRGMLWIILLYDSYQLIKSLRITIST